MAFAVGWNLTLQEASCYTVKWLKSKEKQRPDLLRNIIKSLSNEHLKGGKHEPKCPMPLTCLSCGKKYEEEELTKSSLVQYKLTSKDNRILIPKYDVVKLLFKMTLSVCPQKNLKHFFYYLLWNISGHVFACFWLTQLPVLHPGTTLFKLQKNWCLSVHPWVCWSSEFILMQCKSFAPLTNKKKQISHSQFHSVLPAI